jgi:hypothetical protein
VVSAKTAIGFDEAATGAIAWILVEDSQTFGLCILWCQDSAGITDRKQTSSVGRHLYGEKEKVYEYSHITE